MRLRLRPRAASGSSRPSRAPGPSSARSRSVVGRGPWGRTGSSPRRGSACSWRVGPGCRAGRLRGHRAAPPAPKPGPRPRHRPSPSGPRPPWTRSPPSRRWAGEWRARRGIGRARAGASRRAARKPDPARDAGGGTAPQRARSRQRYGARCPTGCPAWSPPCLRWSSPRGSRPCRPGPAPPAGRRRPRCAPAGDRPRARTAAARRRV